MADRVTAEIVRATDVTLAGDVLRVVHDGLPALAGRDPPDQLAELRARHEPFRRFLNAPPNGNRLVNSCLLYPARSAETVGTFFLASSFGFAPVAGTALMAAAAVAVDEGSVPAAPGWLTLRLDTAVGVAEVRAEVVGGSVVRATWLTRAPRMLARSQAVAGSDGSTRTVSLVATGLPYIVVAEDELGVSLEDEAALGPAAAALSADVGAVCPLSRYGIEQDLARYLVMVTAAMAGNAIRTVWISDQGEVARSAGGTGALAVVAAMGARRGAGPTVVTAPGGSFLVDIAGDRASVTAETRISAKHAFFATPADLGASATGMPVRPDRPT